MNELLFCYNDGDFNCWIKLICLSLFSLGMTSLPGDSMQKISGGQATVQPDMFPKSGHSSGFCWAPKQPLDFNALQDTNAKNQGL